MKNYRIITITVILFTLKNLKKKKDRSSMIKLGRQLGLFITANFHILIGLWKVTFHHSGPRRSDRAHD